MSETTTKTEAELLADGWQRCFVADEPRLSESLDIYRELGFEVTTLPVALASPGEGGNDGGACTACMRAGPNRPRVIYTRKPGRGEISQEVPK